MIPKIIYYTWVNPDPLPVEFEKYIEGWRSLMPDYEIRQISLDNIIKSPFVNEAIIRGKYVVAGHYGRAERLHATGGIYFDIDIEALKSFDDLLGEELFIACEAPRRVNSAVAGSVRGHPFLKDCLNFMDRIDFDNPGQYGIEIETAPEMVTTIAKKYGWQERDETQRLNGMTVFNSHYFYLHKDGIYTNHHNAGTWCR